MSVARHRGYDAPMIGPHHIAEGIGSVFAMARDDRDWPQKTPMSVDGVFASFWAVPLAVPFILLAAGAGHHIQIGAGATDVPPLGVEVMYTLLVALFTWGATLGALVAATRGRVEGWRVAPLIVGQNWSFLVGFVAFGLSYGAFAVSGLFAYAAFPIFGTLAFNMWIAWGVLRRPLGTNAAETAIILAALFVGALVIDGAGRAVFL